MIEMPLNRAAPASAPAPVGADTPSDTPEGAFAEMLGRNLGERIVSRRGQQNKDSQQDAAHDGSGGGAEFYQGTIMNPWTPLAVPAGKLDLPSLVSAPQAQETTAGTESAAPALLTELANIAATPQQALVGRMQSSPSPSLSVDAVATVTAQPGGQLQRQQVVSPPPGATQSLQLTYPVGPLPADQQLATSPAQEAISGGSNSTEPPTAAATTTVPPLPDSTSPDPTLALNPQAVNSPSLAGTARPSSSAPADSAATTASPAAGVVQQPLGEAGRAKGLNSRTPAPGKGPDQGSLVDQATPDVGGSQGTSTQNTALTAKTHSSVPVTLLNRVMEAIEHQQSQPPPRMVVVDMPELEGLRLMVALHSDGKVHVAPMAGSAPPQIAEPFVVAVGEALAAEGFDLAKSFGDTADGRRDRDDHNHPEESTRRVRRTRRPRRAAGLRL